MDQDIAQPLIPCVFCSHLNSVGHRFCGMCGKALPDPSRKVAKPVVPASSHPPSSAPLRGIGGGPRLEPGIPARPIASIPFDSLRVGAPVSEDHPEPHGGPRPAVTPLNAAVASPPPAALRPNPHPTSHPTAHPKTSLHDDPNRDLSYLLEEDHAPTKPSRLPFVVGGLLLAVVAGFFAMRGGGKIPASAETADGTTSGSASEATSAKTPAAPMRSKQEKPAPIAEPAAPGSASSGNFPEEQTKEPPPPITPPPAQEAPPLASVRINPAPKKRLPSPKVKAKAAKASARKPSPSQPAASEPAEESTSAASVAATSDCEKVPALRKAADRGDVRARTSLGLVYYSGQCVPRDLPTAYHWYALALRANPDNAQLSAQLEAIWKQMSSAERQVAIRPQP